MSHKGNVSLPGIMQCILDRLKQVGSYNIRSFCIIPESKFSYANFVCMQRQLTYLFVERIAEKKSCKT